MRIGAVRDFWVTIICWLWFTVGFIVFFSWRYAGVALFVRETQTRFQRLNNRFYRGFFALVRIAAPRHRWLIDQAVREIRSAVVVCNHLSYLDPLLLIALFERHRTIVKTRFFRMPIFGWVIRKAGYFPATAEGRFAGLMIGQVETMSAFLRQGGNLFVFPEGTRSLDGKISNLNRGALKIARMCKAPVYVLHLSNTDKLFPPGKFLFHTGIDNTIRLRIIDRIEPDYEQAMPSASELEERVIKIYREYQS